MLTRRRLSLLLSITLFVSLLLAVAMTWNIGETSASPQILKSRLLRRHDRTRVIPNAADLDLLRAQAQAQEERELDDMTPKHVPIRIKIKSNKERAFKNI